MGCCPFGKKIFSFIWLEIVKNGEIALLVKDFLCKNNGLSSKPSTNIKQLAACLSSQCLGGRDRRIPGPYSEARLT